MEATSHQSHSDISETNYLLRYNLVKTAIKYNYRCDQLAELMEWLGCGPVLGAGSGISLARILPRNLQDYLYAHSTTILNASHKEKMIIQYLSTDQITQLTKELLSGHTTATT